MLSFIQYLTEKYEALSGGRNGHYGHVADNVFYGAAAAGAAGALFKSVQNRSGGKSSPEIQKKTDGSVSVVSVRNSKDSPYHNPKYSESTVGVAYKGRMDAKSVPDGERVAYSAEDVANYYGDAHHLTPVLIKLQQHVGKIHGDIPIIQHDIHTTNPSKDLHFSGNSVYWQPNTVRNSSTDSTVIAGLKKAKIVIASHTGFNKNFTGARGLTPGKDVKEHDDVYNINLVANKPQSNELTEYNKLLGAHLSNSSTRAHLNVVASAPYQGMLERFTNNKINSGQYGEDHHSPLSVTEFKKFVASAHDKEIDKVKTDKAKATKIAAKNTDLDAIDKQKASIAKTFEVHHAFTAATKEFVNKTHSGDSSPIKHELPDGKGGYIPATPEGYVLRSDKHEKLNSQKLNDRAAFNRMNRINSEMRFGKKQVTEQTESDHAVIVPAVRMQPPHLGHDALITDAVKRAKKFGGTAHIYLSQNKAGDAKNPLPVEHRIEMLNQAYKEHISAGNLKFHVGSAMHNNVTAFHKENPNIKHVVILLGDDRMDVADSLKKYNGTLTKSGVTLYKFDSINVEQRKKTPSKYDNIHATELRNKAASGDADTFQFFRERMHKNIPDNMIKKTISYIKKP